MPFSEFFRCYPLTQLRSRERSEEVNNGGKIILPPSALAKLASLRIEYPMLFRLEHEGKQTHLGVLEFIAEEGRAYLPQWAMTQLDIEQGDIVQLHSTTLPLGRFLKIQPQSTDFLDIHDPKAVLENALRHYSALTEGDIISIGYNSKIFRLLCMEIKPKVTSGGISIVETDLEVDFAPPVGYQEPSAARPRVSSMTGKVRLKTD
jgi:ubiquitin fusion degradation protein 1